MSEFADRFSREIEQKKQEIKGDLESGIEREIEQLLEDDFQEKFYSEDIEEKNGDFSVLASDAGRNDIEFRNNTRLYIVQAATVDRDGEKSRKMDTGTLKPYSREDYESFLQRASEIVELESILEKLDPGTGEKTYVLIDGTLLTRLLVDPEELNISQQRDKRLDLIEKFQELLEIAGENENVTVAGVSKDSNSSVLYRTLLKEIIEEKISDLMDSGMDDTVEFLMDNFEKINYQPEEIRTAIENLREGGIDVSEAEELLERYRAAIPDTEMVRQLSPVSGFTQPLRASGIKSSFHHSLEKFEDDRTKFFNDRFPQTLLEKDSEKFIGEKSRLVEELKNSPSVISFYWLPNEKDLPLRIDLLDFGKKLGEARDIEFVEPDERVRDILELLETGYAGEGMHNVWISQADNSASLKNSMVENVYRPLLQNQLGENLRKYMRRRDKRV
ncbi:MAG: DNA double-strand break repair nuclease NurA [Candidatus Nanosalina sp.]